MKAKHLLSSLLLTAITSPLFSQTVIGRQNVDQYPVTAAGALTYGLTYLPADYNPAKKYPLIMFLHGSGEGGDGVAGLNNLINQGIPWWIARGFNPSAVNPVDGKNYEFIVCSPQAPASWQWSYAYLEIQYMMPNILSRYSIDQSRIYIVGLSAGGSGTWSCVCDDPIFARKVAAIMPNSDAALNDATTEGPFLKDITGVYGVPVWCVDGALDGLSAHTTFYVDTINAGPPVANPRAVQTLIAGAGHSAAAWDSAFSPTWRANQFGQTCYEWLLRYQRAPVTSMLAYAGTDQSINLPTSWATLTAEGLPITGNTITNYTWTQISGPNTATIGSPGAASTMVSAMIQGVYTFQLTLKDNTGATATSTVRVAVSSSLSAPPTTGAGSNQTITLPLNSVSLSGTASGNGGATIVSTSWTQTGGPNTAAIGSPSALATTVGGLAQGTYTFQLTARDNTGASAASTVTITVNPLVNINISAIIPTVNAGSNQTITLPANSATLNGLVIGNGASVTSNSWAEISGPNTPTIANPWATTTNVNGLVAGTYTFQLSVNVLGLLSASANVTITVNAASATNIASSAGGSGSGAGGYAPIPGIIQAENYSTMSGVQTENTLDAGGGLDVGWIDPGDWMNYNVNVTNAGTYTASFRVASPFTGGVLQLKDGSGNTLASVNVPNTGNFEVWQTVTANITLPAGNQTLQVSSSAFATWNINWMDFESSAATPPAAPSSGTTIPGIVQAENYSTMSGVQTENTLDAGGGLDVGWIDPGDWMNYNVNVTNAGTYTASFRVASPFTGGILQLKDGSGNTLASVNVPNTGNFEVWQTVTANITLPAGNQTLQVSSGAFATWNINWMDFESSAATSPAAPSSGNTIPGIVQAENYSTMSGIQTENTIDGGGGLDVGWIDQGDWMNYNVNVTNAGTYTVGFRVASPQTGSVLQLKDVAGNVLATVDVPNTGNYEFWQTVTTTVNLPAGNQTLQIYSDAMANWNINFIDFENSGANPVTAIPGIIQGENYSTMSGVQTENTVDAGGGLDVGWIDLGDWMNYKVDVASAGTYTVGFRVATPQSGGVLQLKDGSGNVLATVNVPNTGNFQSWQTVTANITLPAGYQTLQLYSDDAAQWNINWMDFEGNASVIPQTQTAMDQHGTAIAADISGSTPAALTLYPNPTQNNFILNLNNNHTGKMLVQIISQSGQIIKAYDLDKELQSSSSSLSIGDLPAGIYSIRIRIGDWQEIRQLLKL